MATYTFGVLLVNYGNLINGSNNGTPHRQVMIGNGEITVADFNHHMLSNSKKASLIQCGSIFSEK